MVEFLTTNGITSEIEKIIREAKKKLVLVSPYIQTSENVIKRLELTSKQKKIEIILVYGKTKLKQEELDKLKNLRNFKLFYCDNLHAKYYYNDSDLVLCSMNLFEFSEKNNIEVGVKFSRSDRNDKKIYDEILREMETTISRSSEQDLFGDYNNNYSSKREYKELKEPKKSSPKKEEKLDEGFCLRCGIPISFNPEKPLCYDCFQSWSRYENPDYEENYCHVCGNDMLSTMADPICGKCLKSKKSGIQKGNSWFKQRGKVRY